MELGLQKRNKYWQNNFSLYGKYHFGAYTLIYVYQYTYICSSVCACIQINIITCYIYTYIQVEQDEIGTTVVKKTIFPTSFGCGCSQGI